MGSASGQLAGSLLIINVMNHSGSAGLFNQFSKICRHVGKIGMYQPLVLGRPIVVCDHSLPIGRYYRYGQPVFAERKVAHPVSTYRVPQLGSRTKTCPESIRWIFAVVANDQLVLMRKLRIGTLSIFISSSHTLFEHVFI